MPQPGYDVFFKKKTQIPFSTSCPNLYRQVFYRSKKIVPTSKTQVYLLVSSASATYFGAKQIECFTIFRGNVAGYATGRKKKTGNSEHKKQQNNSFQYDKN